MDPFLPSYKLVHYCYIPLFLKLKWVISVLQPLESKLSCTHLQALSTPSNNVNKTVQERSQTAKFGLSGQSLTMFERFRSNNHCCIYRNAHVVSKMLRELYVRPLKLR